MSFYVAAEPSGEPPVHPVDEVLPPPKLALYGAQHVLAFYAGAVIVPILLAGAIGIRGEDLVYLISADLFTCGIASIILGVGGRGKLVDEVAPSRVRPETLTLEQVNALPEDEFVARFGPLFQGA